MTLRALEGQEQQEFLLPAGCALLIRQGQVVEAGMPLAEGSWNPHDLLHLRGTEATQRYLLQEVQRVYRATGVFIHDKHLEVILRQMSRFVLIVEGGDTMYLPGETVDRATYLQEIAAVLAQGGSPAYARPVLLGLTRAIAQTQSWVAAASFQDMRRVLVQATIRAQHDPLRGLKERVVVGKKLPDV